MMKQYLINVSWLDGCEGSNGQVTRIALREIVESEVLKAMENSFYEFNSGIVTERYVNQLINDFGLSVAYGESYHTGLLVFKRY